MSNTPSWEEAVREILYDHWARHRYCKDGCQVEGGDDGTVEALNSAVKELVLASKPEVKVFEDGLNDATHFQRKALDTYQANIIKAIEGRNE